MQRIALDLAELSSVRAFAATVRERRGGTPIDALVLNAGVIRPDVTARTTDGFETTFAVNHLAPYLLLRLLLPALADHAAIVLTVRALSQRPETRARRLTPIAYDPGQVFGTGLAHDLALPLRIAWAVLGTPYAGSAPPSTPAPPPAPPGPTSPCEPPNPHRATPKPPSAAATSPGPTRPNWPATTTPPRPCGTPAPR